MDTNKKLQRYIGKWMLLDSNLETDTHIMILSISDSFLSQECIMKVETMHGGVALLDDVWIPEELLKKAMDNTYIKEDGQ